MYAKTVQSSMRKGIKMSDESLIGYEWEVDITEGLGGALHTYPIVTSEDDNDIAEAAAVYRHTKIEKHTKTRVKDVRYLRQIFVVVPFPQEQ